ncbi:MAG: ribonuclease P protein component [Phycisphaerae bacterium]|nr:ribonuclease P protein component [Phycisphaerae bacterium]
MTDAAPRPFRFTRAFRLEHRREFDAVYAGKARTLEGPLVVHAIPNEHGHHRLGLSIGRRLGNATRRTRLKRMIREAFRLDRGTWPGAYDLVVGARTHEPCTLDDYRAALGRAIDSAHRLWTKRATRQSKRASDAPPPSE